MERMPIDNVHTVCANFYSADEIAANKQMLYQTTTNIRGSIHEYVKRTGDNRNFEDLQDITHLLRVLGTSDTPVFLAQNLDNIPPTHPFDYNSELKRDTDLIKSHMEKFTQNISMQTKTNKVNPQRDTTPTSSSSNRKTIANKVRNPTRTNSSLSNRQVEKGQRRNDGEESADGESIATALSFSDMVTRHQRVHMQKY